MSPPDDRPVTVGVDGTGGSSTALLWAAEEARVRGRPLRILHAAPHLSAPTGADLHAYAAGVLRHARTVVRERDASLEVRDHLVREEPAAALVIASADSELLVLGSSDTARARSGVGQQVRLRASCPVVIVPAVADRTGPPDVTHAHDPPGPQ